ncbi:class I SAM-dependent methyltransferase [Glacieibacterium megasporae]|uniref:class I SAM-dependent methyltransferase n=1 Tax=Glacieibacterium megasporae TaxID=2835787 RepID=UPI00210473F8|nr:methyltransferase domain-containing protein [Polymorphobacter megasporae]
MSADPVIEVPAFSRAVTPSRRRVRRWLARLGMSAAMAGLLAAPVVAENLTLEQATKVANRSPDFVARDSARHPVEELRFFGVTPSSSVIEIWPGGGYWTEMLAPYLHDHGKLTLAVDVPNGEPEGQNFALGPKFAGRLDTNPAAYGRVEYALFGQKHIELASPGTADVVLTFRNLHNWINPSMNLDVQQMLRSIHRALKPGGILGIEDHRGNAKLPQDPQARTGYIRQDYAIALVEKAGFRLVGTSEIGANPRDTADYPHGVWTLPPTYALGDKDRVKYQAIGEADSFVLKFKKVG